MKFQKLPVEYFLKQRENEETYEYSTIAAIPEYYVSFRQIWNWGLEKNLAFESNKLHRTISGNPSRLLADTNP